MHARAAIAIAPGDPIAHYAMAEMREAAGDAKGALTSVRTRARAQSAIRAGASLPGHPAWRSRGRRKARSKHSNRCCASTPPTPAPGTTSATRSGRWVDCRRPSTPLRKPSLRGPTIRWLPPILPKCYAIRARSSAPKTRYARRSRDRRGKRRIARSSCCSPACCASAANSTSRRSSTCVPSRRRRSKAAANGSTSARYWASAANRIVPAKRIRVRMRPTPSDLRGLIAKHLGLPMIYADTAALDAARAGFGTGLVALRAGIRLGPRRVVRSAGSRWHALDEFLSCLSGGR